VRTTNSVASRNRARERQAQASGRRPRIVDETLGCYSKSFICTHGASGASRGSGKRRHAPRSTACPAKLNALLKLVPNGDRGVYRVYVKKHMTVHNHEVSSDVYSTYAEARRVTDVKVLREARNMWEEGMPVKSLVEFLREASGKPVRRQDVDNMVSRWRSGRDIEVDDDEDEYEDGDEVRGEVQSRAQVEARPEVARGKGDGSSWMEVSASAEYREGCGGEGGPLVGGGNADDHYGDGWVAVATPPEYKNVGHDELDGSDGDGENFDGDGRSGDAGHDPVFVIKRWL
jgi:hypothetical protein